jgi:hypothetical protein
VITRKGSLRALLLLVATVPWTVGAGCDLFETRTPPPVDQGGTDQWQPPTAPRTIVENLERALEGANFGNYRRAFAEDFVFRADASDVARLQIDRPGEAVFEGWDRDVEGDTAETIRQAVQQIELVLDLFDEIITPEGRLLKYNYTLTLTASTGVTARRGEAWFDIRAEPNGEWFIYDWEDVANAAGFESWGLLKGRNRRL